MYAFAVALRTRRPRRALLGVLACCTVAVLGAGAPDASAGTAANTEPAFTKTSANNSYWFNWTRTQGFNSNSVPNDTYFLCFRTYRNGVEVESSNGTNGPGSANCTGDLGADSGTYAAFPFLTNTVLDDGATYEMCATGFYRQPFVIWKFDVGAACASTTIDRSKPTTTVFTNDTDSYTRDPVLRHRIDYSDAISPAWLGQGSFGANYVCRKRGAPCTAADAFNYDPNCSVKTMALNGRTNRFLCTSDVSAQADGTWYFCAMAADAAVPDNTGGSNQFTYPGGQPVTSNTANLSDIGCGNVMLDRAAPSVTAAAGATNVTVGQLVSLSASATDGLSGLAASGYRWTFGDNTPGGTGASVNHTYTQAGTYEATVTTSDNAGNDGTGRIVVTVSAAPAGGGTPPAGGGTLPGGGGTLPGGGGTLPGGTPPATPPSPGQIAQAVGGGGTQQVTVGGLELTAPKRLSTRVCQRKGGRRVCSRLANFPIVLTPNGPGKVDVALVRGGRVVTRSAASPSRAGSFELRIKLPSRLRPGSYSVKVNFTPRGGTPVSKILKLKVVAGPRPAR